MPANAPADDRVERLTSILCVGNGGLVARDGLVFTHRSMADFLTELAASGCAVCFCHWREPDDDPLARTLLAETAGLRVQALAPVAGGTWRKLSAGTRALIALAVEIVRADFVYLYWPGRLSEVAARLARVLGKPFAFYLRGGNEAELQGLRPLLGNAMFAIAAGNALRDHARQVCRDVQNVTPMTPVRVSHLQAPVDGKKGSGPWRLLYVGRVEASKGIPELIDACERLRDRSVPVELLLIGHCDNRREMLARVDDSIGDRVRFIDAVTDFEDLADAYRAADFFVLPSHSEGFPRVLYEAMAFGLPVVTTFVGGIPTLMIDGENCRRVNVGDPDNLADTLAELILDPEQRLRIARAGYRTMSELLPQWRGSHALQVLERMRGLGGG
jgi:glycosyltransferase involved in cell wall biosynthesis